MCIRDRQNILYSVNNDLAFKKHPATYINQIPSSVSTIIEGNLNSLNIDSYGFIVIDYFSTAMAISSASNLPIIYFNLGPHNLNKKVKSVLEERVYWVDINFEDDIKEQVRRAFRSFFSSTRKYNKQYSVNYSLSDGRLDSILNDLIIK